MMAEPNSDAATDALVAAARSDREAFGRLYDIYYPRIFGYCLRRLFTHTAAEDATGEVFLRVASKLPAFPGCTVEDFQRWLYRIAINEVNNSIRKKKRRERHWDSVGHHKASVNGDGRPGELTWPDLHEALMRLSAREQTIVVLRFYQGMSHEEIGSVLDRRPGAIRVALSRAIAKLRRWLEGVVDEGKAVSQREQPT